MLYYFLSIIFPILQILLLFYARLFKLWRILRMTKIFCYIIRNQLYKEDENDVLPLIIFLFLNNFYQ